jgi:threonine dehydrogenase-like Zn-dependent dehydrogenase
VVFGAGIIGLGVVQCLRALEVDLNQLIVVDVSDLRLDVAKRVGADVVVNAAVEDPHEKVVDLVGTAPLMYQPRTIAPLVDVVYDCVGYIKDRPEPLVIQKAMDMLRDSTGRLVVHGLFEEKVLIDFEPMVAKQIDVLGSFGFVPAELEQSLEMMRAQEVDRRVLISHEFGLDQAKEAFETQGRVEESVKVLIKP